MITILTVNDSTFSINGVTYNKVFQPLKMGANNVALYNTYDTRFQLLSSTPYTEISVDGTTYLSQALTIQALLAVVWTNVVGGGGGGSWGEITGVLSAQTDLQAALDAKADNGAVYSWAAITGKPTTIAGFGITDAFDQADADGLYLPLLGKAADSNLLDGFNSSSASTGSTIALRDANGDINARLFRSEYDTTNASVNFIMTQVDTASNNYVRPSTPAQFRAAVIDGHYVASDGIAANSQLLDSINSTQFIRSDVNDNKTAGYTRHYDNSELQFGTGNDANFFHNGSNMYMDLILGNFYIRNGTTTKFTFDRTGGNLTSTGAMNATGFFETSQRKLKENIKHFNLEATEILSNLNVVTYDRIDGDKNKVGIIIDDSPAIVANPEHTAVDIYKTLFLTVKAIQELDERLYNAGI